MAVSKGNKKKSPGKKAGKKPAFAVLFWLAFAIFIFGLFLLNREVIGNSIQIIQNTFNSQAERPPPPPPVVEVPSPVQAEPVQTVPVQPAPVEPVPPELLAQVPPEAPSQYPPQTVPDMRDRALFFTQVDRSGTILRVRVDRSLPASGAPMTDVLQALLAGPNEEERNRGLISLIPTGTQLISATIRDETAFINFNDDFQFNTYGVEGYAAQLREIVFTVTEFPNIKDVQILIDGRRIDFLGEGIWIGSPLSREMF